MIDVFEELNGHHDDAEADAKAAEDVFKGLDMVRLSISQRDRIFVFFHQQLKYGIPSNIIYFFT